MQVHALCPPDVQTDVDSAQPTGSGEEPGEKRFEAASWRRASREASKLILCHITSPSVLPACFALPQSLLQEGVTAAQLAAPLHPPRAQPRSSLTLAAEPHGCTEGRRSIPRAGHVGA